MSAEVNVVGRNRPAHLARRDACVERAVELLSASVQGMETDARMEHMGNVIALLESASRHARLAARAIAPSQEEADFRHFLDLILNNVRSAHAFLKNQSHLESEEHSFLESFLGVSQEEMALAATNYRRSSEDMVAGLWQFVRMMYIPFRGLKDANATALDESARERYERAYRIYGQELAARYPPPLLPPPAPPA